MFLASSSRRSILVCMSSGRERAGRVNLCVFSKVWIRAVSFFYVCLSFSSLFVEIAISSPHIMHLCASQLTIGDTSGELFSRKYWRISLFTSGTIVWSVSRDGSRCHVESWVGVSANSMDMDTGWWSDKYMGSMVALVSIGRSLCEMNS